MLNDSGKTSLAQLVFFVVAIVPSHYVLFKHGVRGFLGWFSICLFCAVRIVGAAMIVHYETNNQPVSEAALIISSIAIAPLMIALGAISHESFGSIENERPLLFSWAPPLINHAITIGAIVLIIIGLVMVDGHDNSAKTMKIGIDLVRSGTVILVVVWAVIAAIVMVSYTYQRKLRGEKQLAAAASIGLVCLIVRILYVVLGAFINTPSYNVRTGGTLAEKVILDVLPEFILFIAVLTAGLASRNIKYETEASTRSKDDRQGGDVDQVQEYGK